MYIYYTIDTYLYIYINSIAGFNFVRGPLPGPARHLNDEDICPKFTKYT